MHLRFSVIHPLPALLFIAALAVNGCSSEPKAAAFKPPATHGIVWKTLHPFSRDHTEQPKTGVHVVITPDSTSPSLAAVRQLGIRVRIENFTKTLVTFSFPTSQRLEIVGRSAEGKIFYNYTTDRNFTPELAVLSINPGEYLEYNEAVPTKNMVAGGNYVITASLVGHSGIDGSVTILPKS